MRKRPRRSASLPTHMRTSSFILGDDRGVSPSNTDQGYILRRLIRRAVRYGMQLGMPDGFTCEIAKVIINQYKNAYPELERNAAFVIDQLTLEEGRFARTLKQGNQGVRQGGVPRGGWQD